jgi:hypothetical protein
MNTMNSLIQLQSDSRSNSILFDSATRFGIGFIRQSSANEIFYETVETFSISSVWGRPDEVLRFLL